MKPFLQCLKAFLMMIVLKPSTGTLIEHLLWRSARHAPSPQTAKYGRGVDEAHQSVAKIRTKPHHVRQKSAPMWSTLVKNLHKPILH